MSELRGGLANRRRTPRHCVEGLIEGKRMPGGEAVTVLDLSHGGLSMRLDRGFEVGEQCQVHLWSQSCPPIVLPARIVYSMRVRDGRSNPYYFAGLEFFTDPTAAIASAIERLITSLAEDAGARTND